MKHSVSIINTARVGVPKELAEAVKAEALAAAPEEEMFISLLS